MDMIEAILEKGARSRHTSRSGDTTVPPPPPPPPPRRLVVAASNGQYADFATNFAHSLLSHDVSSFVFVPLDAAAYTILHERFPEHTVPVLPELVATEPTTSDATTHTGASFRSKEFEVLTSSRPIFLEHFLRRNITIFYNDIDMVWQYNAWETIDQLLVVDRNRPPPSSSSSSISSSSTTPQPQYDVLLWKDGPVQICTCLIYMVPSPTSFRIIQEWKDEIQTHLHPNDQKAFLVMAQKQALLPSKRHPKNPTKKTDANVNANAAIDRSKVQIFANSEQFPTGAMYDWEKQIQQVQEEAAAAATSSSIHASNLDDWKPYVPALSSKQPKTDPHHAIIIHNNWIEGKVPKIQRFIQSNLWWFNRTSSSS